MILAATEATDDKNLLNFWFAKDENSMAQYYLLHPISSKLPAYVDEGNAAKKKQVWHPSLFGILQELNRSQQNLETEIPVWKFKSENVAHVLMPV